MIIDLTNKDTAQEQIVLFENKLGINLGFTANSGKDNLKQAYKSFAILSAHLQRGRLMLDELARRVRHYEDATGETLTSQELAEAIAAANTSVAGVDEILGMDGRL